MSNISINLKSVGLFMFFAVALIVFVVPGFVGAQVGSGLPCCDADPDTLTYCLNEIASLNTTKLTEFESGIWFNYLQCPNNDGDYCDQAACVGGVKTCSKKPVLYWQELVSCCLGCHTESILSLSGICEDYTVFCSNTPPPGDEDIGVDLKPSVREVVPGISAVFDVEIKSIEGFMGPVTLVASGCPTGACTFDDSTRYLSNGGTEIATLTISNTSSLDYGSYDVTVVASGNGESGTDTSQLVVVDNLICSETAVGYRHFVGCLYDGRYLTDIKDSAPSGPQKATSGFNDNETLLLDQTWGMSDPVGVNQPFSVRWKGSFNFSGGSYLFDFTGLDDSARVWVDGVIANNDFWDIYAEGVFGAANLKRTIAIPAGVHEIWIDYQDLDVWSQIKLSWSKVAVAPTYTYTYNPNTLDYTATQNAANPASKSVTINNTGNQTLNFTLSDNKSWISVSPSSLSVAPGTSGNISVSITDTTLAPALYSGVVTLSEPNNVDQDVTINYTVNPPIVGCNPAGLGTGLTGNVFDGTNFNTETGTLPISNINYSPSDSIGVNYAGGGDTFSVRWEGEIEAQCSETYTFYTYTDDGVMLWVDGTNLINKWVGQQPKEWSNTINLIAGQKYPIKMEYFEGTVTGVAQLSWSSPSIPKAIIPSSQMTPLASVPPDDPTNVTTSDAVCEEIRLSWNTASGADSYRIYRNTSNSVPANPIASGVVIIPWIDSSAVVGTSYYYWVESFSNSSGVGPTKVAANSSMAPVACVPQTFSLTVIRSGQGTVTSVPSGIACGVGCQNDFDENTTVVLTATPNVGRVFTGWSINYGGVSCNEGTQKSSTCTFTINGDVTVLANFIIDPNYREF